MDLYRVNGDMRELVAERVIRRRNKITSESQDGWRNDAEFQDEVVKEYGGRQFYLNEDEMFYQFNGDLYIMNKSDIVPASGAYPINSYVKTAGDVYAWIGSNLPYKDGDVTTDFECSESDILPDTDSKPICTDSYYIGPVRVRLSYVYVNGSVFVCSGE